MENGRGEGRIGAAGREDFMEVLERAGAAGRNDRDRHRTRNCGRQLAVETRTSAVLVDGCEQDLTRATRLGLDRPLDCFSRRGRASTSRVDGPSFAGALRVD